MTYLIYSICLAGLYMYLGLGLTVLISPPPLKRYALLLAPLIGYCYITLAGWYCFVGGLRGTDTYATAVSLPPLGLLLVALARQRGNMGELRALFNKDAGTAFALGLSAFLAISVPSMFSGHGLTAMSLGNADLIHYSLAARYLKSFSIGTHEGFLGQVAIITQGANDRFGTVLATALPSSLFSFETYQLQNILTHLSFAFGVVCMVYLVGREVFRYKPLTAAIGGMLVAANPLVCYTTYHYFEGQIVSMALALGLIALHVQAARAASVRGSEHVAEVPSKTITAEGAQLAKPLEMLGYVPLTALLTWGVSVAYGHMLPLVLGAVTGLVCLLALRRRSLAFFGRWIGFCLVTLLVTLACSPERARLVVKQVFYFNDLTAGIRPALGWPVPWLVPAGLFTLPNAFPFVEPSTAPAAWASGTAFVLLMVWALSSSYRADRDRFNLIAGCSVVVLGGYALMSIVDRSDVVGYSSYKWLSFFLPLLLPCLVAPLAAGDGIKLRPSWWLCLAVIGLASVVYSAREVGVMMRTPWVVRPEIAALQRLEANSAVDSINILADSGGTWGAMWKTNFLMRKKLYHEKGSYWPAAGLIGNWNLDSVQRSRLDDDDDVLRVGSMGHEKDERIDAGPSYALSRAHLQVTYGLGWHPREPRLRWTGNGWGSGVLHLSPTGRPTSVSVAVTYWPLNPHNGLAILLNHEPIARCPASGSCIVPRVALKRGDNVLEFRSALPPERPSRDDARSLAYAFTKIEIDRVH